MAIIDGNIIRTLQRIRKSPKDADHLVDEEYRDELIDMLGSDSSGGGSQFSVKDEFATSYKLIKDYINSIGAIGAKEDLDVIKEAQKFLSFILRNEEKLANIEAVKEFKEAVLDVLDEESNELRDRVITKLSSL